MVVPGAMDRARHHRRWRLGKAMASFAQYLQYSGVYAEQSFMIIPRQTREKRRDFNLVCLRDSKDVHLSYDRSRFEVEYVDLEQVERVAQEYIDARYSGPRSPERDDQLLRLRTALHATARPEGHARGLKASAKG